MSDLYEKLLNEKHAQKVKPTQRRRKAHTQEFLARLEAELPAAPLWRIANTIREDWTEPYFGAVPYLEAMRNLQSVTDMFYLDHADDIVRYFLSNAQTWRGDVARMVKRELRRRV